ncbi:GNAT family N-acetyltransferase [Nocardioides KLBMP 9356]|uniref:GNAT family N-acetyltransferase n=1 Tax=Nocardioides potassii TaxID=2911371 RepID=A0ABS9H7L9_9ACTN|nr:GNAT family N-acetyltransferase [Nocardioides potassii]MCF6376101.1 GNAT family N-acetyltransferase [Nocardioides potassii]
MTPDELRAAYDDQLRTDAEMARARGVTRIGPLLCAVFDHGGFVSYRDLGGTGGEALDELVEQVVAHFRDETDVDSFEWKSRGHDLPADLGERLLAHGFEAEPVETVMIGEASLLAVDVALDETPEGPVVVRRIEPGPGAEDDLTRMLEAQESVFGTGRGPSVASSMAELESGASEFWVAEVGGRVVSGGRLTPVEGTDFAGIWGGSTLPDFRGRGIYRALVAARASSAVERGIRYIHSDCTDMSRPILERSGLQAVTTTTPYVWTR